MISIIMIARKREGNVQHAARRARACSCIMYMCIGRARVNYSSTVAVIADAAVVYSECCKQSNQQDMRSAAHAVCTCASSGESCLSKARPCLSSSVRRSSDEELVGTSRSRNLQLDKGESCSLLLGCGSLRSRIHRFQMACVCVLPGCAVRYHRGRFFGGRMTSQL